MAVGKPSEVLENDASPTARALARGHVLRESSHVSGPPIVLEGAQAHNLDVDRLEVPTGCMVVVAGVSGSGKSSLIGNVLFPAVRRELGLIAAVPGKHRRVTVPDTVLRAIAVDQAPIGRTSRSVPATFLKVWDAIRKVFAATSEARLRGYKPTRFSFNSASAGGRCTTCGGSGVIAHEISFLPDVKTECEACGGSRFEPATLEVRYRGLSIGDVLRLTVNEACEVFAAHPKILSPLSTLRDLGVGYVQLGQGSPTLSGGEAQRLKLAKELTAGRGHKATLYVLDEPTTGLHQGDVARLVSVLDRLVQRGDSLLIIEHHPAVIAAADHVIELGPEGGADGGRILAQGAPRDIAAAGTATGVVLQDVLGR